MIGVSDNEYRDGEDAYVAGLLLRIARRERGAMEQFYAVYQEPVYRLALVRLGHPASAAQVLQALMLQIWTGMQVWRPGNRPRAWILRLVARASQSLAADADDATIDPSTQAIVPAPARTGMVENLHTALRRLPDRYRTVLHLAYFEHLDDGEIAHVLDLAETAVGWNRRQGRDALSAMLGGNGETDARARDLFLDAWMRRELRTAPDPAPCDFGLDRLKVEMRGAERDRWRRRMSRRWVRRPIGRVCRWVGWGAPARDEAAVG
ncbi:MAG: polymerase [Panacagrimonas sp.]|jgi:RNA polymerase sigma-70 factor (ECF subfamily)|nr:RNA polymerase sigma factor [Panacagrimonas sp.]MCC2657392.1 polymerase [Panacagrimonas sp.]